LIASFLLALALSATGQTNFSDTRSAAGTTNDPVADAKSAFNQALVRYQKYPNDDKAAWEFSRAAFDWGEFASNRTQRAEIAEQGIAASETLIARQSNSAVGHYYLGMNLGQLARTKTLGALKLVNRMEHEFELARDLDENLDYAGPDRCLGLLYFEAPVVGSVGSRSKAKKHLQRAAELAGGYPENRLNLIEAYLKWKDIKDARRELELLEAKWAESRSRFSGAVWNSNWADWENRLRSARQKMEGKK
jgi:hypothetical protein